MYQNLQSLLTTTDRITLVLNNGFERRTLRSAEALKEVGLRAVQVLLLRYDGPENKKSYAKVSRIAKQLVEGNSAYLEVSCNDADSLDPIFRGLDLEHERVVCDISGLSRHVTLTLLTMLYRKRVKFSLIYTEAKEYYPRRKEFRALLRLRDPSEAFEQLTSYEKAEIVYSSKCDVQEIVELPGRIFPNHPVMLIGFLAFKRSRLSCILTQYETNARTLIQSVPVRQDLRWRERALEIINFDLVDENRENIIKVPTLDWTQTYKRLSELYRRNNARYRFNTLLAPIGGKMQTLGAWVFAVNNPDVKVVISTPQRHFSDKYSMGYTATHLICMDSIYNGKDQGVDFG